MNEDAGRLFLDFSSRKLALHCSRIETCLGMLSEEQIWARGGENENAVGIWSAPVRERASVDDFGRRRRSRRA